MQLKDQDLKISISKMFLYDKFHLSFDLLNTAHSFVRHEDQDIIMNHLF